MGSIIWWKSVTKQSTGIIKVSRSLAVLRKNYDHDDDDDDEKKGEKVGSIAQARGEIEEEEKPLSL